MSDSFEFISAFGLINGCSMSSPSALPVLNINSSSFIVITSCTILQASTYWAIGTGTLQYSNIAFIFGVAPIQDTLTITSGESQTGSVSFDNGDSYFNPFTQGLSNQLLVGTATSAISSLPSGSVGQYLQSNGGGLPQWVDLPQPRTTISE
jgi:hypothetical protein